MAIKSLELDYEVIQNSQLANPESTNSLNISNLRSKRKGLTKVTAESSLSGTSKCSKNRKNDLKSPYLNKDAMQIQSYVSEKRHIRKKGTEFISSFPLAVNIYKANSDEFKSLKRSKKVKKSVLTLPNESSRMIEQCTVSDMNDSEYLNRNDDSRILKPKKRCSTKNKRKSSNRNEEFELYDRDAEYCSRLNINLDCSSTDMIKNFTGDGKKNMKSKKPNSDENYIEDNLKAHDVWTVLRNINRFHFRPSPPMSDESIIAPKKRKGLKKRNNRKDRRVIETCRTEEYAYISRFDADNKSLISFSRSSSFDRVTVIDKQDELNQIYQQLEKKVHKKPNTKSNRKMKQIYIDSFTDDEIKFPDVSNTIDKSMRQNNIKTTSRTKITSKNKDSLNLNSAVSCFENKKICGTNFESSVKNQSIFSTKNNFNRKNIDVFHTLCDEFNNSSSDYGEAGIASKINNKDMDKIMSNPLQESNHPVKEFKKKSNKETVSLPKAQENQAKKNRLFHKLPISPAIPKLTRTEIKKRLDKLSFPIVVTGENQLSSKIQVIDQPSQFDGLESHIWPFMVDWYEENNQMENHYPSCFVSTSIQNEMISNAIDNIDKLNLIKSKDLTKHELPKPSKDKKVANHEINNKLKLAQKLVRPKPIRDFKDKMLNFLYKRSPVQVISEQDVINKNRPGILLKTKVDVSTDTHVRFISVKTPMNSRKTNKSTSNLMKNDENVPSKHPWAKAKWASDFIDNVIKKIKHGVYYNHESLIIREKPCFETKEAITQTALPHIIDQDIEQNAMDASNTVVDQTVPEYDHSLDFTIPGFENAPPVLEIKSLNMNQIAIMHCLTNIMVQFDVAVHTRHESEPTANDIKKCSPSIRNEILDSQTKVFKCKTTIVNAILPAELCSILPRMMYLLTDQNLTSSLVPVDKTASQLSTITELSYIDGPESYATSTSSFTCMSHDLRKIIEGSFFKSNNKYLSPSIMISPFKTTKYSRNMQIIPKIKTMCVFASVIYPTQFVFSKSIQSWNRYSMAEELPTINVNTCTALQLYPTANKRLIPAFEKYDFYTFISKICCDYYYDLTEKLYYQLLNSFNKSVIITITNEKLSRKDVKINSTTLVSNSDSKLKLHASKVQVKRFYKNYNQTPIDKVLKSYNKIAINKGKRKSYMRLRRKFKCKTASYVTSEKLTTPLSKITSLECFLHALGLGNGLCDVLDGHSEQKLMASLSELKTWITDISPRQALLIFLLISKKDTSILTRFRPILLQGIAVNRITRADELDMEIEVIEQENFIKLTQYEGISSLRTLSKNHDLLEELNWIAKTTASDYQRPYDESSEKFLKSLLEKRKKLNPSYLRVMARYVGLGLLKGQK